MTKHQGYAKDAAQLWKKVQLKKFILYMFMSSILQSHMKKDDIIKLKFQNLFSCNFFCKNL